MSLFFCRRRFADIDVPKNTIVSAKRLIQMSKVSCINDVAPDEVLLFKNVDEVERFISLYEKEGQHSREEIVDCLAHFIWSFHNIDGVTLNASTWSVNHGNPGEEENVHFFREDDAILGKTVVDLKVGDELLNNYRDFDYMDDFWMNFLQRRRREGRCDKS